MSEEDEFDMIEDPGLDWPKAPEEIARDDQAEATRRAEVEAVVAEARKLRDPTCRIDATAPHWAALERLIPALSLMVQPPHMPQLGIAAASTWEHEAVDATMATTRGLRCRGPACAYCDPPEA